MIDDLQWRQFFILSYSATNKKPAIVPVFLTETWIRVEILPLPPAAPKFYRGGWVNPVVLIHGRKHILPGQIAPMGRGLFNLNPGNQYQVRFNPVPYLPPSIVRFYRGIPPQPSNATINPE